MRRVFFAFRFEKKLKAFHSKHPEFSADLEAVIIAATSLRLQLPEAVVPLGVDNHLATNRTTILDPSWAAARYYGRRLSPAHAFVRVCARRDRQEQIE
jgi:hypothetical protein